METKWIRTNHLIDLLSSLANFSTLVKSTAELQLVIKRRFSDGASRRDHGDIGNETARPKRVTHCAEQLINPISCRFPLSSAVRFRFHELLCAAKK